MGCISPESNKATLLSQKIKSELEIAILIGGHISRLFLRYPKVKLAKTVFMKLVSLVRE